MLKIEGVAIGNIILRRTNHESESPWKETKVNITYLNLIFEFPEDYKPIPLTREYLSKFKFHQKYTSDPQEPNPSEAWFINDFHIHSVDGSLKFFFHSYDGLITEIKYVHQLQNLYFDLKIEQLTIKN